MREEGTRMSAKRKNAPVPVGLGLRALKGGSVVVGVAVDGREPRVVLSTFLATAADGDRLSLEPYHLAFEMKRGPRGEPSAAASAAVAEGRRRQGQLAAHGLDAIVRKLKEEGFEAVIGALLVNRAGWITDLLAYSLAFPEHPPVAEGLAVRDALRLALGQLGIEIAEMDEKSLHELASKQLRLGTTDIEARVKTLGATAGPPWRKEQKLACLSAWVAVATR
jgi:hypothetical protein